MLNTEYIRRVNGWTSARIVLADGSDRIYSASGRGRAQRLIRMVESLDWERIELLGAQGEIVEVVARDGSGGDDEEQEKDPVARQVAVIARETRRNTETMRAVMQDALRAHAQAISILSSLVQQLASTHQEAVEAIREAATTIAPPPSPDDGQDRALVHQLITSALPRILESNSAGGGNAKASG